jgi:hypothetical protein
MLYTWPAALCWLITAGRGLERRVKSLGVVFRG